jgi:hypothetical protein
VLSVNESTLQGESVLHDRSGDAIVKRVMDEGEKNRLVVSQLFIDCDKPIA